MNLRQPAALLWPRLAIPIVVFYILKIRLRRVPVSTLMFWQQIFEEKKPRSIWQRLRHLISLLLQLAFLALLVFALADPIFRWQQARARRIVLVVDNSASMNASDVAPSRLEAAKAEGRRLIDGHAAGRRAGDHRRGAQPQVACGLTDHQRTLREALDSIAASDGPTRVAEAVTLARRLLSGSERCAGSSSSPTAGSMAPPSWPARTDVELIALGSSDRQRRHHPAPGPAQPARPDRLRDPRRGRQRLGRAGRLPARARPGRRPDRRRPARPPARRAQGRRSSRRPRPRADSSAPGSTGADALPADNTAWAILPRRSRQKVTLVTPGNLFLEKVFEAIPLVDLRSSRRRRVSRCPADASAGGAWPVAGHGLSPRRCPTCCRRGTCSSSSPSRSGPLWQFGESLHNPVVAKQDKDSPLMAHIRLDNVLMPEARKLTLKRAGAGPGRVGRGRSALRGARSAGRRREGKSSCSRSTWTRATCRSRPPFRS